MEGNGHRTLAGVLPCHKSVSPSGSWSLQLGSCPYSLLPAEECSSLDSDIVLPVILRVFGVLGLLRGDLSRIYASFRVKVKCS